MKGALAALARAVASPEQPGYEDALDALREALAAANAEDMEALIAFFKTCEGRKVSTRRLLRNWAIVFAGNFAGALATAVLIFLSGQFTFGGGRGALPGWAATFSASGILVAAIGLPDFLSLTSRYGLQFSHTALGLVIAALASVLGEASVGVFQMATETLKNGLDEDERRFLFEVGLASRRPVTFNGLDHRNRNCWFGIDIGPRSRWNRGFGQEATILVTRFAFRQLGMEKVYLGVIQGNERAMRVYRRAGYEVEAELSRSMLIEGRLVSEHWMAVYRDHPLYA